MSIKGLAYRLKQTVSYSFCVPLILLMEAHVQVSGQALQLMLSVLHAVTQLE